MSAVEILKTSPWFAPRDPCVSQSISDVSLMSVLQSLKKNLRTESQGCVCCWCNLCEVYSVHAVLIEGMKDMQCYFPGFSQPLNSAL